MDKEKEVSADQNEKHKQGYLGLKLGKPYWIFTYKFPNGFIQTVHGLN